MLCLTYKVSYDSISSPKHNLSVLTRLATPGAGFQDTKRRFEGRAGRNHADTPPLTSLPQSWEFITQICFKFKNSSIYGPFVSLYEFCMSR